MAPDPKPPRRIVDPNAGLEMLHANRVCPGCLGDTGRWPLTWWPGRSRHHLIGKGQRGDDVQENILVLCGSGTTGCHGALTDHRPGWERVAANVGRHLLSERPDTIEYLQQKLGDGYEEWFERFFPQSAGNL